MAFDSCQRRAVPQPSWFFVVVFMPPASVKKFENAAEQHSDGSMRRRDSDKVCNVWLPTPTEVDRSSCLLRQRRQKWTEVRACFANVDRSGQRSMPVSPTPIEVDRSSCLLGYPWTMIPVAQDSAPGRSRVTDHFSVLPRQHLRTHIIALSPSRSQHELRSLSTLKIPSPCCDQRKPNGWRHEPHRQGIIVPE